MNFPCVNCSQMWQCGINTNNNNNENNNNNDNNNNLIGGEVMHVT